MPKSYQELIRLVRNGDPVDSSINRIFREQSGNIEFIKALLDESLLGSAITARDVTVSSDVNVGQPVYFNSTTQRYEQAFATAFADSETGEAVVADSAQVWGICSYKHNSTKADILLHGYASINMTAAITGTAAGLYYLSGSNAGKLVKQSPPVTVAVLYWDGAEKVYVNPSFNNAFLNHQHYKFNLLAAPAGTSYVPFTGGSHVITEADSNEEGWLPADHAVFAGKAPAGARFGYNIAKSSLNNVWPPFPIDSASLSWVRPKTTTVSDVVMRGDLSHTQVTSSSFTVNAASTYELVIALVPPGGFPALNYISNDDITATVDIVDRPFVSYYGLEIDSVTLSDTNEITCVLRNNTDDAIEIDGEDVTICVYDNLPSSTAVVSDFYEDTVPSDLVQLDNNGIWWMSACYGMAPWPALYGSPSQNPNSTMNIAVSGDFSVSRREFSDTGTSLLYGNNAQSARGLVVDRNGYSAYVAIAATHSIVRVSLNESHTDPQSVVWTGDASAEPYGLGFGEWGSALYWTDFANGKAYYANLNVETLQPTATEIATGLSSPRGITAYYVDDEVLAGPGYLFICEEAKISRCKLDGTDIEDFITGLDTPETVVIYDDYIFWTDWGAGTISRALLTDGSGVTDIVTGETPRGLCLNASGSGFIFTSGSEIKTCNFDGSSVTTVGSVSDYETLYGVDNWFMYDVGSNVCSSVDQALTLWFTKLQFQSATTVVTSLRATDTSGLTIRCIHGDNNSNTTGDLEIDFNTDNTVDTADTEPGHIVFKRLAANKFYRGPVVEAIKVNSAYLTVSSTDTSGTSHRGTVTLSYTPTAVGAELPVESVRLNNVEEEHYEDTLALSFRQDIDSEFRAKVNIPGNITASSIQVKLRFVLLARAAGDLPTLSLTARVVPRPGQTSATSLALPTSDTVVTLSSAAATGMEEDDYVELQSGAISTTPGSVLLFTLGRSSSDSFPGDIHLIDQRAVVTNIIN